MPTCLLGIAKVRSLNQINKMKYFFLTALLFSNVVYAQKIDKIEIDKFTKTKKVTTKPLDIEKGLFKFMSITFLTDDTTIKIHFYGSYGKAFRDIGPKSPVVFLFDDNSTTRIYPPYHQATHTSEGVYDERAYFSFNYSFSYENLKLLASKKVISFRSEFTPDINYNDKVSENLKVLAQLVLDEMPIPVPGTTSEKTNSPKVITPNTPSGATNATTDLLRKWHIKLQRQDKDGNTVEYEMTKEFLPNNEVEINTGKNIIKGKYEIANGGKYIITNIPGQPTDISEIISLEAKTLIIKGSNGKLYIYTSE